MEVEAHCPICAQKVKVKVQVKGVTSVFSPSLAGDALTVAFRDVTIRHSCP